MENLLKYALLDGTFLSPKNNKIYKSKKAFIAHMSYKGHVKGNDIVNRLYNVKCDYCEREIIVSNIKKHVTTCYLNPINLSICKVCNSPIKDYKRSKGTCSHSCSNKLFRISRNKPEKYRHYTTICWQYHNKECIVCGEQKIVAVHHYNEDHNDNNPSNLVPLCPTHHQYMHSKYKNEIEDIVTNYVNDTKLRFA